MLTIDALLFALTLFAALGCGLMAGLFFAFSTAVMEALARLPAAAGIAAMQSINVAILNPLFLATFLGTGAVCFVLMVVSLLSWRAPGSVPAHRKRALSGRHLNRDAGVQRAQKRSAGIGRAGRPRWGRTVGGLSRHVDRLESCTRGCRACGRGVTHHRAALLSG